MPRTADPALHARRREAIVTEAGRLFGGQGFEKTTVAQIAYAAGLSPGSVFYYFTDKQALFRAVFEQDLPRAEALIARHQGTDDPAASVLDIVTELAADAADPGASGMVVELLRRVGHDPELLEVVHRASQVVCEGLAGLLARGIETGAFDPELDPVEAAAWLESIVDAVYLNARPEHSPLPALRRTVARYLAPPGTEPQLTRPARETTARETERDSEHTDGQV